MHGERGQCHHIKFATVSSPFLLFISRCSDFSFFTAWAKLKHCFQMSNELNQICFHFHSFPPRLFYFTVFNISIQTFVRDFLFSFHFSYSVGKRWKFCVERAIKKCFSRFFLSCRDENEGRILQAFCHFCIIHYKIFCFSLVFATVYEKAASTRCQFASQGKWSTEISHDVISRKLF